MKLVLIFLAIFTAGPVFFALLARPAPARKYIIALCVGAAVLVAMGFAIAKAGGALLPVSPYPGLGAIVALWLAWISVLALCFQAIKMRATSLGPVKAAYVVGAMATTLPWFGLYAARIMGS